MSSPVCRNIKLMLSYDGSDYNGWQKQKNTRNTIQEILEFSLSKMLNEKVSVIGAGRTDAGAHAVRQVANFKTTNLSIPPEKFRVILNGILPESIRVVNSEEVGLDFNSRYSAKFRKYIYLVFIGDEKYYPFIGKYSLISKRKDHDLKFLRLLAKDFLGEHDFLCISSKREYKTTVRFVKSFRVFRFKDFIVFSMTANGFMYNMARGMVSVLLEAERRNDKSLVRNILLGIEKIKPTLVPSNGLYLHRVYY
ncbi:MAG: tRNA pseudouridine(38-40) synthase TruA [Spirochaetia bacterium]|nr:tRNA pseudouridine(38-40) synthase TruA [Spirochaetota bacterium]MCX8096871.1 tRNA pseudouridine(38-40) synthase TruA [Spirochaetota bacterium]MDW8112988.1 tRNA pseudouridine(38-40) synthase TruA [Spirochaetia bacterium]